MDILVCISVDTRPEIFVRAEPDDISYIYRHQSLGIPTEEGKPELAIELYEALALLELKKTQRVRVRIEQGHKEASHTLSPSEPFMQQFTGLLRQYKIYPLHRIDEGQELLGAIRFLQNCFEQRVFFRDGFKFGCDLLLYLEHFDKVHSEYLVYLARGPTIPIKEVINLSQTAQGLRKRLLVVTKNAGRYKALKAYYII